MNMKKIAALTLSAALAVTTFAACGAKPASSTPAPATSTPASSAPATSTPATVEGTIKFSVWDLEKTPYLQTLADEFTKVNPGIKVEIVDTLSADYTTKLGVMLDGGSDVDVFLVKDADTSLGLFKKGQMLDITELVKKDNIDLASYNGTTAPFTFDGKLAAMPFRTDYYVLYYNKDIFDAAKVAYPTNDMTWTQFEETAKKISSGEGATRKYGAFLHTWNGCVMNWAFQDGKHTMMDTDLSYMKPYYDMALRMQNTDKSIMDFGELTSQKIHYSSPFLKGDIGMMPMGTWFMSTIIASKDKNESSINWGVATIPHPDDVKAGNTVGSSTPIAINPSSKNQAAAWEFVKFATTQGGADVLSKAGQIPSSATDDMLATLAAMPGMPEGTKDALKTIGIVVDRPIVDKIGDINKMLGEEHGLIMLGENSVDDGLKSMGERSKEIQGK